MNLEIFPVQGFPEIVRGDDLAKMICDRVTLADHDVIIVTQKIVSKAEGAVVDIDANVAASHKPLVERESIRVLRRRGDLIISQTKHGFICANAGVDLSNVGSGRAALLPEDSDRSARRIRDQIKGRMGAEVGVIVSDTFGRPWRRGVTDVAIGCAGVKAILDLRGTDDALGRPLTVTEVALVDQLASAAELCMGKSSGNPVAVIRGGPTEWFAESSVRSDLIRSAQDDLFR